MSEHKSFPLELSRCGDLAPMDFTFHEDLGKDEMGRNMIRTVGRIFAIHGPEQAEADAKRVQLCWNSHAALVEALKAGYVHALRQHTTERMSLRGQKVLSAMRDALALATESSPEQVQNHCEAIAMGDK